MVNQFSLKMHLERVLIPSSSGKPNNKLNFKKVQMPFRCICVYILTFISDNQLLLEHGF